MAKSRDISKLQDNIIGQFKRDIMSQTNDSAVHQALKAGRRLKQNRKPQKEQPRFSYKFLTTNK